MRTHQRLMLGYLLLCACSEPAATPSRLCDGAPPALPPVSQTLELAGETFDIVRSGPDTGQVVLLLQGFPDQSVEYRAALPRLAAAGYRAVAAIRRGPGAADQAGAAQVLAIADALALQRFHVAGAQLAWDVATRAPERVLSVATTSPAQIAAVAELERNAAACARAK